MESLHVTGKVTQILEELSGEGRNGPWRKRDFILETAEQYPKTICITQWGDEIDKVNLQEGQTVTAYINIQSREYNGRWYTDVRAWRLSMEEDQASGSGKQGEPEGNDRNSFDADLPDVDDDLPF